MRTPATRVLALQERLGQGWSLTRDGAKQPKKHPQAPATLSTDPERQLSGAHLMPAPNASPLQGAAPREECIACPPQRFLEGGKRLKDTQPPLQPMLLPEPHSPMATRQAWWHSSQAREEATVPWPQAPTPWDRPTEDSLVCSCLSNSVESCPTR